MNNNERKIKKKIGNHQRKKKEKFGSKGKSSYLCIVKGEANRRQIESNQARLNCRDAKEEGEAKQSHDVRNGGMAVGKTYGDDEQFDLAAWFPSLKYRAGHVWPAFFIS